MKLKVYVVPWRGRTMRLVAANSRKHAAELTGVSLYWMRKYGTQTFNAISVSLALGSPGTVYDRELEFGTKDAWKPLAGNR